MPIGIPSGLGGSWLNTPSWMNQPSPNDLYQQNQLAINPNWGGGPAATSPIGSVPSVSGSTAFNVSPQPRSGTNAFGYIPGQLGLPNPAEDLGAQIPGLQGLNAQYSGLLNDYLGGQIPLDVQNQIRDTSARRGVTSGMPGSGLTRNIVPRDLGLTSLDLQKQGLAAYNPFVATVSQTQTLNPALQAQIAEQNAVNAAAPDPTLAASYAKRLYDEYLKNLSRSGRSQSGYGASPAGGTGAFAGPSGGFLPHVNDNLSYTPGAFDFASQFTGDSGPSGYGDFPATSEFSGFPAMSPDAFYGPSFDQLGIPNNYMPNATLDQLSSDNYLPYLDSNLNNYDWFGTGE